MARHPHKSRGPLVIVLAVVLVLLVGYVLSIGPACRVAMNDVGYVAEPVDTWQAIYAPLLWVTDRSKLASWVLSDYLKMCAADEAAHIVDTRTLFHAFWEEQVKVRKVREQGSE